MSDDSSRNLPMAVLGVYGPLGNHINLTAALYWTTSDFERIRDGVRSLVEAYAKIHHRRPKRLVITLHTTLGSATREMDLGLARITADWRGDTFFTGLLKTMVQEIEDGVCVERSCSDPTTTWSTPAIGNTVLRDSSGDVHDEGIVWIAGDL